VHDNQSTHGLGLKKPSGLPTARVRPRFPCGNEHAARAELEADTERMFGIFLEIKRFENALRWTLSGGHEPPLGLVPIIMQQVYR
jgi:hypothetical protein